MKFCEHIEYLPEKKTYLMSSTMIVNDEGACCGKCGAAIDLSDAIAGGVSFSSREHKRGLMQLEIFIQNDYRAIDKKAELPHLLRMLADHCEKGISKHSKHRNFMIGGTDLFCTIKNESGTK